MPTTDQTKEKILKNIPKSEKIAVQYTDKGYILTQHLVRNDFILYKIVENGYQHIGQSKNPFNLEKKYLDEKQKGEKNEK